MGSGSGAAGGAGGVGAAAGCEAGGANCAHAHVDHRTALSAQSQTADDLCLVASDMSSCMNVLRTTKWRAATFKLYRDASEAPFMPRVVIASTTGAARGRPTSATA